MLRVDISTFIKLQEVCEGRSRLAQLFLKRGKKVEHLDKTHFQTESIFPLIHIMFQKEDEYFSKGAIKLIQKKPSDVFQISDEKTP